jgi:hypothetical protein
MRRVLLLVLVFLGLLVAPAQARSIGAADCQALLQGDPSFWVDGTSQGRGQHHLDNDVARWLSKRPSAEFLGWAAKSRLYYGVNNVWVWIRVTAKVRFFDVSSGRLERKGVRGWCRGIGTENAYTSVQSFREKLGGRRPKWWGREDMTTARIARVIPGDVYAACEAEFQIFARGLANYYNAYIVDRLPGFPKVKLGKRPNRYTCKKGVWMAEHVGKGKLVVRENCFGKTYLKGALVHFRTGSTCRKVG